MYLSIYSMYLHTYLLRVIRDAHICLDDSAGGRDVEGVSQQRVLQPDHADVGAQCHLTNAVRVEVELVLKERRKTDCVCV